ncbi:MAG TPA: hypothetical protein PKN70_06730 [Smithellaceae bacterium]|nr:hypothetical protein [Smithellaceae bacterium]
MRIFNIILILILCLLFCHGCTSASVSHSVDDTTPVSFTMLKGALMKRSVGKLRRLVVLPVLLDVEPRNPKWCLGKCEWEGLDKAIEEEVVACLQDKRGYEIIALSASSKEHTPILTSEEVSMLTDKLVAHAHDDNLQRSPEDIAVLLKAIGNRTGLDGIMLIHGKAVTLNAFDYVAWYATFSLFIPVSILRVGVTLKADIYETSTGRNVWTGELTGGGVPNQAEHYGMKLCDVIESAIPRILTQPVRSVLDNKDKP